MNDNPIISLPVSADLSAYSHVAVKLTSTGIALASVTSLPIGTMIRGNSAAVNAGDTVIGRAAAVKVRGNGLNFVTLGANSVAIAQGDELDLSAAGVYLNKATAAAVTGAITGTWATGLFTSATAHRFAVGQSVRVTSQTGAVGITAGDIFTIGTTPSTTTFTLSPQKAGAILGTAADVTYWTSTDVTAMVLQHVGDGRGNFVLAVDSAPVTSTGGVIRAIFL